LTANNLETKEATDAEKMVNSGNESNNDCNNNMGDNISKDTPTHRFLRSCLETKEIRGVLQFERSGASFEDVCKTTARQLDIPEIHNFFFQKKKVAASIKNPKVTG
jgi:hypothetical protein